MGGRLRHGGVSCTGPLRVGGCGLRPSMLQGSSKACMDAGQSPAIMLPQAAAGNSEEAAEVRTHPLSAGHTHPSHAVILVCQNMPRKTEEIVTSHDVLSL